MPTTDQHPEPPPAIEINGVGFSYPPVGIRHQPVEALASISMSVLAGARLGILGPNGGGKSTLIRLILGTLTPSVGTVRVFGKKPAQAQADGLIGYLPQRIEAQRDWPISIRQAVGYPIACRLKPWQRMSAESCRAVDEAIALVGLGNLGDRTIGALSGGQLQRAMIARAIAGKPKLLVLDEPTVGVDIAGQQQFAELMNTLHTQLNLTTVIVTHDLRAIATVADRVACLSRTLHFHDDADGLSPQLLADVFAHDMAAAFGRVHVDAHLAEECNDPNHSSSDRCGHNDHNHGCGCDGGDQP